MYAEIIQSHTVAGVRWRRFPILTELLKGHRRGELTVFTGPTGAGKTTFLSEYSLDLCGQDVRTLWGSFEIRNVRLAKMMLQQFSGLMLESDPQLFDVVADEFEKLPMYFLAFHGQQNVTSVLDVWSFLEYSGGLDCNLVRHMLFFFAGHVACCLRPRHFAHRDRQSAIYDGHIGRRLAGPFLQTGPDHRVLPPLRHRQQRSHHSSHPPEKGCVACFLLSETIPLPLVFFVFLATRELFRLSFISE